MLDDLLLQWKDLVAANPLADDAAVLGLILIGILINWLVARSARARALDRREQWIRSLAQQVLRSFRQQGAERIEVNWKTRSDTLEIHLQFAFGNLTYAGHLQEHADHVIQAISEYAKAMRDQYQEQFPTEDDLPEDEIAEDEVSPTASPRSGWWTILGVSPKASKQEISIAYRRLARENHPDGGGDEEKMAAINAARDEALASNS